MSKPENITPERLRCVAMASCPSIHRLADGRLLIVGCLDHDQSDISDRDFEAAIIISPDLLDTLKAEWIAEYLKSQGDEVDRANARTLRLVNEALNW